MKVFAKSILTDRKHKSFSEINRPFQLLFRRRINVFDVAPALVVPAAKLQPKDYRAAAFEDSMLNACKSFHHRLLLHFRSSLSANTIEQNLLVYPTDSLPKQERN